jgi:hypothetical protein
MAELDVSRTEIATAVTAVRKRMAIINPPMIERPALKE